MRRISVLAFAISLLSTLSAEAQVGLPGVEYAGTIAGGDGVQLYPYDQQDPWLHGYFQRYPAYGGFASFRPYNYRHVFSQTQLAAGWGAPHGMPYSQQFWNRYRSSYLNGNLHSQMSPMQSWPSTAPQYPVTPAAPPSWSVLPAGNVRSIGWNPEEQAAMSDAQRLLPLEDRPVHVFP